MKWAGRPDVIIVLIVPICGFDTRIEGYEYHRLEKYSKEDVLEKIHIAAQEER